MLIPEQDHSDIWNDQLSIPVLALDIVILTIYKGELCVIIVKTTE